MSVLAMSHVSKRFRTRDAEVAALDDLSLDIGQGQVLGLLGPNGAGKTTTVRIACGLLIPDSGQVLVLGKELAKHRSHILGDVGVMLEPGKGIYKNMTVFENILYWGLVKGLQDRRELKQRANALIQFFDLEAKKDSLASTLSTGMTQKLNLCCTLVTRPKLLLLDEPNAGMDLESSSDLVKRLKQLAKDEQCAVLVTSHQMDFMEDLCDEVAFISSGRIILRGTINEVRWLFRQKYYKLVFRRKDGSSSIDLSQCPLPGVVSIRDDLPDGMVELIVDSTSTEVQTILRFALEESLDVVTLELVRPSLKECYQMLFSRGGATNEASQDVHPVGL